VGGFIVALGRQRSSLGGLGTAHQNLLKAGGHIKVHHPAWSLGRLEPMHRVSRHMADATGAEDNNVIAHVYGHLTLADVEHFFDRVNMRWRTGALGHQLFDNGVFAPRLGTRGVDNPETIEKPVGRGRSGITFERQKGCVHDFDLVPVTHPPAQTSPVTPVKTSFFRPAAFTAAAKGA